MDLHSTAWYTPPVPDHFPAYTKLANKVNPNTCSLDELITAVADVHNHFEHHTMSRVDPSDKTPTMLPMSPVNTIAYTMSCPNVSHHFDKREPCPWIVN